MSLTWLLPSAAVSLGAAMVLASPPVAAQIPPRLGVDNTSSCPSAEEVIAQLGPLMPESQVTSLQGKADAGAIERVSITETAAGLRVGALGETKEFGDLPSSCTERARLVAVFVYLKFAPLRVTEPDVEQKPTAANTTVAPLTSPPSAPREEVSDAPTPTDEWGAAVSLVVVTNLDARALQRGVDYGLSGRIWAGARWGVAAGASLLFPGERQLTSPALNVDEPVLRLWRTPVDVALRYRERWSSTWIFAELGVEAALLRVWRLTASGHVYRLEWGGRASLGFGYSVGHGLTLGGAVFATLVPMPYELRLEPQLRLGSLPAVWGGGGLGLWF